MQFDSHTFLILILNLTFVIAFSCVSFRLLENNICSFKYSDNYSIGCQLASTSPVHLQIKKY